MRIWEGDISGIWQLWKEIIWFVLNKAENVKKKKTVEKYHLSVLKYKKLKSEACYEVTENKEKFI